MSSSNSPAEPGAAVDVDRALLSTLARDGRASYTELAEKVGLSVSAVHQRVRRLEQRGLITGYRAMLQRQGARAAADRVRVDHADRRRPARRRPRAAGPPGGDRGVPLGGRGGELHPQGAGRRRPTRWRGCCRTSARRPTSPPGRRWSSPPSTRTVRRSDARLDVARPREGAPEHRGGHDRVGRDLPPGGRAGAGVHRGAARDGRAAARRGGPAVGRRLDRHRPAGPTGRRIAGTAAAELDTRSNMCSYGVMRWDAQRLDLEDPSTLPGMPSIRGLLRSVQVPEFPGLTFHEVRSRSALNHVPGESAMPFPWTINPYRGCCHACLYCFARRTHEWLEFDSGRDFDTQVVVKTNLVEVLRARAGPAVVAARARRAGHQHRPVPAGRGPLPADARRDPGAGRLRARRSRS